MDHPLAGVDAGTASIPYCWNSLNSSQSQEDDTQKERSTFLHIGRVKSLLCLFY